MWRTSWSSGIIEFDYDDLHARYTHPHFGHRGGEAQEVAIMSGNDIVNGNTGDDVILGDSAAVFVIQLAETPQVRYEHPDPELFELKYQWREDFELRDQYRRDDGVSQIGNDQIFGGLGNDLLYGQHRDDHVYGEEDDDLVYGGDGGSDVVDGGPGVNDVRTRGDNWPKLAPLVQFKELVFASLSSVAQPLLRNVAAGSEVTTNSLPFEPLAGNLIVGSTAPTSSESLWQNLQDNTDVNNDGVLSPLDALLVINELNGRWIIGASGRLPDTRPKILGPLYLDVNGDGLVSPLDALIVINELNKRLAGEGESATVGNSAFPVSIAAHELPAVDPRFGAAEQDLTAAFATLPDIDAESSSNHNPAWDLARPAVTSPQATDSHSLARHKDDTKDNPLESILDDIAGDVGEHWTDTLTTRVLWEVNMTGERRVR